MSTQKLTKTVVENFPLPQSEQVLVFDSELRGFGVRLSANTRSFFAERRVNGKTRRVTLGRYPELTVVQARTEAQRVLGQMAAGADPNAKKKEAKTKAVTLYQAFQDFRRARKSLKPQTAREYQRVMTTCLTDWLDRPWTNITGEMVLRRHTELGEERGEALANQCGRVLRAVMNFAIANYRDGNGCPLIVENPVTRISRTRGWYRVERRTNYIKAYQLSAWLAAVNALDNETVRDYFTFVLFTGLRRSEAEMLRWNDVDFADRSFTIQDPKNRQPLTLPLSDFLVHLLSTRRKNTDSQFVFPARSARGHLVESRKQRARVIEASGIDFTIHDLRRTFATIAESLDISAYALKALLNHKTNSMDVTGGYIQMNVERLRRPVQQITDYILSAANIRPKGKVARMSANPGRSISVL